MTKKQVSTTNKESLKSFLILKYGSESELFRMWFDYQRHPNTLTPQGDLKLIGELFHHEYID